MEKIIRVSEFAEVTSNIMDLRFGITVCQPDSIYFEGDVVSSKTYPSSWTGAYGYTVTARLRGRGARRKAKAVIYRFGDELWRVVDRDTVEREAKTTSGEVIVNMVGPDLNATRAPTSAKFAQWDGWRKAIRTGSRRCVYLRYYGTVAADNRNNGSVVVGERTFSYAW